MARKPFAALGVISTPHGDVIARKLWKETQGFFVFQFDGPHQALRWMLPHWRPVAASTKTQVTPPTPVTSIDDTMALFQKLQAAWRGRLDGSSQVRPSSVAMSSAASPYHTLAQLRSVVEAEAAGSLRASTVRTYRHQWDAVLSKIPDSTAVAAVDRIMIQGAVTALSADGLSPVTVRRDIEALGRLLTRAVDDGVLTVNPVSKVRLPKAAKREPRFLTPEQRQHLLEEAQKKGRDAYLLIALAVYLGLRKAELGALRWEHVDLAQKVAHVVNQVDFTTKNGKFRAVPICEELHTILTRHRHASGYVLMPKLTFTPTKRYRWEFRDLFASLVVSANLPDWVTPHVLRHTFASLAAQAGVSLYKIGAWMGHSMTEVTEIYAHLAAYDPDINRMAASSENEGGGGVTAPLRLVK